MSRSPLPRDERGTLVVARDCGTEHFELALIADLSAEPRLPQQLFRLRERRIGDDDQPIGEHGVEVRLGHVERELRALRGELDFGGCAAALWRRFLPGDAAAGVDVLRDGRVRACMSYARRSRPC